jgi:putative membrane protein
MRGYPDHMFYGPRLLGGGLSFLMTLMILGLLVYLVVLLRREPGNRARGSSAAPSDPPPPASPGLLTPSEVVKMRYARGEITREEYETIRKDLE